ncbi:MAG: gliding motility-associated C-terminal domain-containing protein, partial [Elusimicrobia bacterium]|nr:gliding motility-associated C-terminal domain-containing protein [Elusimicrobiota bacterium]
LGAASFAYAISTSANNPPLAVVGGTSTVALTGTVSALIPNTTYFGFVQACNGVGCSVYTAFGSTVTWANPPITLSTTTLDSTSTALAWAANNNPTGTTFEIEQATASGGSFSLAISTTGVSTPITGLSPGTTACFRVLARSWDGVPTAPTSELCVVPPFSTPSPSAISASGTNAILASWTTAPGATSYTFTVSTASDNPPLVVSGSSSTVSLSASVSSLTPNTTYFGFVKGCNGVDCSNDTALGSAVTLASVPAGLSSGTVTAVSMALAFNINGNPPGTAFEIELAVDGGSFATALTTTSDSPTLSGLTPGANYTLRIRAINHNGIPSGYSPTLSFTTSATLPATPVNFRGSAGAGGITYSWDPVTTNALGSPLPLGATVSYEFSESNSPTGSFAVLASTTATSHGPLPAAGLERFYRLRTEVETLFSLPSTVIDNVGAGRYVYASTLGSAVTAPQGLLTGVGNSRHVISLSDRPITDGALVALDIAVIDGVTGAPATNITFSPSAQLSVPLPGVSSGERSVEYFNGSAWVLAGTARILSPNLAQFSFGRTGGYRLMGSKSSDVVQSVIARVFTPNGDGRNDVTVVRLDNPNGDPTHGTLYDTDGARVADMTTGPAPGLSLTWDGRDANGNPVPGGVYIYQVTVGGRRATGTIVVSK